MATMFGMYPFLMKLYADGGYQGPLFRRAVAKIMARVNVEIVKRSDHAKGFVVLPKRMGRRTNVRMARAVQASRQRLGESQSKGARISAPRFNQNHAEKTMQSRMISPDECPEAEMHRIRGRPMSHQSRGISRLPRRRPISSIASAQPGSPLPPGYPVILLQTLPANRTWIVQRAAFWHR